MKRTFALFSLALVLSAVAFSQTSQFQSMKAACSGSCCHDGCGKSCCKDGCAKCCKGM